MIQIWSVRAALLAVVLSSSLIGGCSPGSSSVTATNAQFLNVELDDNIVANTLFEKGMFQVYLNRKLEGTPTDWKCIMTVPFQDTNYFCSGNPGGYDANDDSGNLKLMVNGVEADLALDFSDLRNVLVSLDLNDGNPPLTGRARFASTRMEYSGHIDHTGAKSLLFDLYNIPPVNNVGDSAFDTADLFAPIPDGATDAPWLGLAHLWDAGSNYASVYRHYRLTPVNNGYPQGLMGYVEYSGDVLNNADLIAGEYKWYICELSGAANCADSTLTNVYSTTVTVAEANLDPQAASGVDDTSKLYTSADMPSAVTNISINGIVGLSTVSTSATDVAAAGPYTLVWSDKVQNPSTVDWQVSFTVVDSGTGQPVDQFSEVRSPRKHDGETDGPVYDNTTDPMNPVFTWNLPSDLTIAAGTVVKVQIRVTNPSRTLSANLEPFYLQCTTC